MKATANAGSNIAFVKYWGVRRGGRQSLEPLNPSVSMTLDKARLYNRALTADEVAASGSGDGLYISEKELLLAIK